MSDRTINFGDSEADSRYQAGDDAATGGDFIVVRDLDNNLIPLQYDYASTQLLSGVGLDLGGNDLSNAGAVTADALEAGGNRVAPALSSDSNISEFNGTEDISGNTFFAIFDVADPVDVVSGSVMGEFVNELRITFADESTKILSPSPNTAQDGSGDNISTLSIPPARDVVKLEFQNESAKTIKIGYECLVLA